MTAPAATICTPTIERMSVLLPQPFGPSSPVTVPSGDLETDVPDHPLPTTDDPQAVDHDRRLVHGALPSPGDDSGPGSSVRTNVRQGCCRWSRFPRTFVPGPGPTAPEW